MIYNLELCDPKPLTIIVDAMPRLKTVTVNAALVAMVVFCGYSIPVYLNLLAHQPGRDAINPTSFPPAYAFLLGGYYAALTFVVVCGIYMLIRLLSSMLHRRKTVGDGEGHTRL